MLVIDFLTGTAPDLTVSAVAGMGAEVSQLYKRFPSKLTEKSNQQ